MPLTDRQTDFSERKTGLLNKYGRKREDSTSRSFSNTLSDLLSRTRSTTQGRTTDQSQFNTAPTFRGGEGLLSSLINRFQGGGTSPTGQSGVDFFNQILGQQAGQGGFVDDLVRSTNEQSDYSLPGELNQARGQFGGRGPAGRTSLNIDDALVRNKLGRDALTSRLRQDQYNTDRSLQSNVANILANLGSRETDQSLALLNALKGQSGAQTNVRDQYSTTDAVTNEQRRSQTDQIVNSIVNSILQEQSDYDQQTQSVKTEEGSLLDEIGGGSSLLEYIFKGIGNLGGLPKLIPFLKKNPERDPVGGGPVGGSGVPILPFVSNQNPPRENPGGGGGTVPIPRDDPPGDDAGRGGTVPIPRDDPLPTEQPLPGTNVGTDPDQFRPIIPLDRQPPTEQAPGGGLDPYARGQDPYSQRSRYNTDEATTQEDVNTPSNVRGGGGGNFITTAAMLAALASGRIPIPVGNPFEEWAQKVKSKRAHREMVKGAEEQNYLDQHEIDGLEQDIERIEKETADLTSKNRIDAFAVSQGVVPVGTSFTQAVAAGQASVSTLSNILNAGRVSVGIPEVIQLGTAAGATGGVSAGTGAGGAGGGFCRRYRWWSRTSKRTSNF